MLIDTFKLKANCVVLATDMQNNKKYILSNIKDDIELPHIFLNSEILDNLNLSLIDYLHQKIPYVTEIELIPQLISLHSEYIKSNPNDLNIIYGFLVTHQDALQNSYWIEFDELKPNKYSNIIFEVIQKLY